MARRIAFKSLYAITFVTRTSLTIYFPSRSQRTQNICITFVQRQPNVFDVGPALYLMLYNGFVFAGDNPREKQKLVSNHLIYNKGLIYNEA